MKHFFYSVILLVVFSCANNPEPIQLDAKIVKEKLLEANKVASQMESDQIDSYVKRRNLNVIKTGTGLRYYIYQSGDGEKAENGVYVKVHYTVSLLNGTVCYSTKEKGAENFLVGEDNVESGLHEGITYLHVGDKAQLIIPSHLAHGLAGDLKEIPPRSTIIYDIELLAIR